MRGHTTVYNYGYPCVFNRGRTQAVEAENGFVVAIINRNEGFRTAQIVAPASVTAQKVIQRVLTAVERDSIMFLADRLFVPSNQITAAAQRPRGRQQFSVRLSGFSNKLRTRTLSRPKVSHDPLPQ